MAADPSFDIVCKPDLQEVDNAVNQAQKELATRFDFRGSTAKLALDKAKREVSLEAESENRLAAVLDIFQSKLIKRGVSIKALELSEPKASGMTVSQTAKVLEGIPMEKAKAVVALIKESKLKVQAAIMGDLVRVSGKNKDDLQEVIARVKRADLGIELSFTNYR